MSMCTIYTSGINKADHTLLLYSKEIILVGILNQRISMILYAALMVEWYNTSLPCF